MFGSLGFSEILFILVLALLIFGPRKLPEIGRTIGRSLAEFRKASTDLKRSLNAEMIEEEMRQSDPRKIFDEAASGEETRDRRKISDEADEVAPEPPSADDASTAEADAPDSAPVPRGSIPRGDEAADAAATPAPETVPEPEAQ